MTEHFNISEYRKLPAGNRISNFSAPEAGLYENEYTGERVVLQMCDPQKQAPCLEKCLNQLQERLPDSHLRKNIMLPKLLPGDDGSCYVLTEAPHCDQEEKICLLQDALYHEKVPAAVRMQMALHLAEIFLILRPSVDRELLTAVPEGIYANIETAEIFVWLSPWLEAADRTAEPENSAGREMDYLLSVLVFGLLFAADPFDGRETLVRYPCLTKSALREIHSGCHDFVLSENGRNGASQNMAPELPAKWKQCPDFLQRQFKYSFEEGIPANPEQWLMSLRRFRDGLILAGGRPCFCHPEQMELFICAGSYTIPVFPRKAVYWYHVGLPYEACSNGVAGGVRWKDGCGRLENSTHEEFQVTCRGETVQVGPGAEVQLKEDMRIRLTNGCVLYVAGGTSGHDKGYDVISVEE